MPNLSCGFSSLAEALPFHRMGISYKKPGGFVKGIHPCQRTAGGDQSGEAGIMIAERDQVAADIRKRGIRRREFERFITELEKLPGLVTEFDEALWGSLVDHLTVNGKDDIVFTMSSGMEIKA